MEHQTFPIVCEFSKPDGCIYWVNLEYDKSRSEIPQLKVVLCASRAESITVKTPDSKQTRAFRCWHIGDGIEWSALRWDSPGKKGEAIEYPVYLTQEAILHLREFCEVFQESRGYAFHRIMELMYADIDALGNEKHYVHLVNKGADCGCFEVELMDGRIIAVAYFPPDIEKETGINREFDGFKFVTRLNRAFFHKSIIRFNLKSMLIEYE